MPKTNLIAAQRNKKDEFYTQRSDIERELKNYNHLSCNNQFKDKIVYCNCDDPTESHFFKYFADNFSALGLKKLICTHYENNPKKKSYILIITKGKNKSSKIGRTDVEQTNFLSSNGDFRSNECVELLKESDIVVTNPPFSLFREYIAQLVKYRKQFLIIANQNAMGYKEIFPLIKENKVWLGSGFNGGNAYFKTPNYQNYAEGVYNPETGLVKFRNCCWFTNLDYLKRHEEFIPKNYKTHKGNEKDYPKYDNYDAIEVSKIADIPIDYDGAMGVPITFLDKYNPAQFEIIKFRKGDDDNDLCINGKCPYYRILIKRKGAKNENRA